RAPRAPCCAPRRSSRRPGNRARDAVRARPATGARLSPERYCREHGLPASSLPQVPEKKGAQHSTARDPRRRFFDSGGERAVPRADAMSARGRVAAAAAAAALASCTALQDATTRLPGPRLYEHGAKIIGHLRAFEARIGFRPTDNFTDPSTETE